MTQVRGFFLILWNYPIYSMGNLLYLTQFENRKREVLEVSKTFQKGIYLLSLSIVKQKHAGSLCLSCSMTGFGAGSV